MPPWRRCELPATAVCWLSDEPQPGMVLVEFADARGRPHQLAGKCAYFGRGLQPTSSYPCPTSVPCTIEDIVDDTATVSTVWLTGGPDDTRFVFEIRLAALRPATNA